MEESKKPKKSWISYWLIALCVFMLLQAFVFPNLFKGRVKEVGYDTFISMTENKEIGSVKIESSQITFTDKDEKQVYQTGTLNDPELIDRLYASGAKFESEIDSGTSPLLYILITCVLPIALMLLVFHFFNKKMVQRMGGGDGSMMFGMGKSNAKVYVKSTTGIKFKDVAGEANVPFFSISGSEFVEMFVGMGAAKVRDLFKQANEKAPCIVFIDEIDTIGKKRDGGQYGGNDEREQTLNQLLTEMDGFDGSKGVVILAATNRPESLDPALLRPGRFDRRIPVELPDLQGRIDILKVHAQKIKLAGNVDFSAIARTAAGASGAELANIINEAALRAVRLGRSCATQEDLMESVEVVIAGYQKKNRVLSNKEKLTVSYHEVGHALVAALQSQSAPVQKITIIPRTSGALGYTMQVDEGEHYLMTKTEMENKIATLTGGRAAEKLIFHEITTGASNDIEQATKLARSMVSRFGMSSEFGMVAMETVQSQYLGGDASLTCSMETQTKIDKKVTEIIQTQYDKAMQLLQTNQPKLHEIAKYLYEHETITGEEFMQILNRPMIEQQ